MQTAEQTLYERGWSKERLAQLKLCPPAERKYIRVKNDLSLTQHGEFMVIEPVGYLKNEIVYHCRCSCGKGDLKTTDQLLNGYNPNCGHLDGTGYDIWKKNFDKLHAVWRNSFERFKNECLAVQEGKPYLNRKFKDRKLGPGNFFWSYNTEREHEIHREVVDILMEEKGLKWQEANEETKLMGIKKKRKVIADYNTKHDVKFMSKYGRKPLLEKIDVNSCKIPTRAICSLISCLDKTKYNDDEVEFLLTNGQLMAKLSILPAPMIWNEDKGDWDL